MLSGDYINRQHEIMELDGINFLDRLIFVMKFLNKDSKMLIENYKKNAV